MDRIKNMDTDESRNVAVNKSCYPNIQFISASGGSATKISICGFDINVFNKIICQVYVHFLRDFEETTCILRVIDNDCPNQADNKTGMELGGTPFIWLCLNYIM